MDEFEFAYPCRPWNQFKCDADFLDPIYLEKFNKWHHGCDYNLNLGGDSDLGYPVQSVFPGIVVEASPSGSWGNIILVRTDMAFLPFLSEKLHQSLNTLDVQYAHLMHMIVKVGDVVNAGDTIGSIGKGSFDKYPAHLHLEMRKNVIPYNQGQGNLPQHKDFAVQHYLNPQAVFSTLKFTNTGNIQPRGRRMGYIQHLALEGGEYALSKGLRFSLNWQAVKLFLRTDV